MLEALQVVGDGIEGTLGEVSSSSRKENGNMFCLITCSLNLRNPNKRVLCMFVTAKFSTWIYII